MFTQSKILLIIGVALFVSTSIAVILSHLKSAEIPQPVVLSNELPDVRPIEPVPSTTTSSSELPHEATPPFDPQPPIEEPDIEIPLPPETPISNGCFKGGCSGQLCTDSPDMVSTCEWRDEYACYQSAICERQASGKCGWTMTESLTQCLNTAR